MRTVKDTDERLLWMLRILADEFGGLGVLKTCVALWPDAADALAAADPQASEAPR